MPTVHGQQSGNVQEVSLTDDALNAYLAELSHELKNLLNSVALVLQLAGNEQQRETLERGRRHIQAQGREIVLLVDSLRDLAQLSQGGQFREDSTSLLEPVTEAVVQAREIAEPLGIDVSYSLRQNSPFVSVTKQRLTRILFSLLLDRIDCVQNEECIEVIVEDDGPAAIVRIVSPVLIAEEEADDILQWPDPQPDEDGKLHKRLRAPIARSLVQWHGGDVSLKALNSGECELALRLPVVAGAAEAEPGSRNATRKNLRVLVVDDNVDSARTVATYLRLSGHRVDTRHDGRAALDAAKQQHPDVLVLDLGLPKLDGYEVAQQLRDDDEFRNTRLIAVSGYGHDEALVRSRRVGFDHHLVKPVDNKELLSLIELGGVEGELRVEG